MQNFISINKDLPNDITEQILKNLENLEQKEILVQCFNSEIQNNEQ